ncbi:hypothetical protein [Flavihumibacter sp. CACIAM 22H1]|uniref:hypothetical protein n=1 Tax=Flavihumibacter sp. CACIAM 22H1 TaxID=1812911 RepID=UPI0007A864F2|nr:hypothetical protein [Flavihumibacter sp. CACIAM 22H1]KYP13386.1 MAG: hypothetical protein A1D16_20950 [Flavihumibacter sp. CACIAM 22H1]
MNNLLNILTNSNKDIDNQLLMDYISGKLSHADRHTVEEWLQENEFEADALEGLEAFGNKDELQRYVVQLNKELKNYLQSKKQRREKKRIRENPWTFLAVLLILLFLVLAYIVLQMITR